MALTLYLSDTRTLLQNPQASTSLYPDSNLTRFVNIARDQVAGEAKCIRVFGTLATVASQQVYAFSSIITSAVSGIRGVYELRQANVVVGTGAARLNSRPFAYFMQYYLNQTAPVAAQPTDWAQYGEGFNGTIYLHAVPDKIYTLNCDTVCMPIDLVDDTTAEAIPLIWQQAVPFFAAHLALISAQRGGDADKMLERYQMFLQRARDAATPEVLSTNYPQSVDPTLPNKLGMHQPRQRGG